MNYPLLLKVLKNYLFIKFDSQFIIQVILFVFLTIIITILFISCHIAFSQSIVKI
jgi:hypothetical protein